MGSARLVYINKDQDSRVSSSSLYKQRSGYFCQFLYFHCMKDIIKKILLIHFKDVFLMSTPIFSEIQIPKPSTQINLFNKCYRIKAVDLYKIYPPFTPLKK